MPSTPPSPLLWPDPAGTAGKAPFLGVLPVVASREAAMLYRIPVIGQVRQPPLFTAHDSRV